MKSLIILFLAISSLANAADEKAFDRMSSHELSAAVAKVIQQHPKLNGFRVISETSGMSDLSSFGSFIVESGSAPPRDFIEAYRSLLTESMVKLKIKSGPPTPSSLNFGLRAINLATESGEQRGTISIVSWQVSDSQFGVIVAAAISP